MFAITAGLQRAKKVVSDNPELVDSVLNLPDGKVNFFGGKFKLKKNCNQSCSSNFWGAS